MRSFALPLLALVASATALPAPVPAPVHHPIQPPPQRLEERGPAATVSVSSSASIIGGTLGKIESYKGIPFAQAGRLEKPQRVNISSLGANFDATGLGPSCPQMFFSTGSGGFLTQVLGDVLNLPLFQTVTGATENCLTINVQRPAGTKAGDKLPVLFWIFGGGFEVLSSQLGSTAMYDGSGLIANGMSSNQPFVFVAVNYRTGGFGFLPGKEVLSAGVANLGLLDQRAGLEWVSDNIELFGGDPDRVTIWGESAGAISVLDQMALYGGDITHNGRKLFRGAIMNSGSIVPADPVDCPKSQVVYNTVVSEAGCAGQTDTLACLKALPYQKFLNAANSVPGILSYNSVALSYLPRPDGNVLPDTPDELIKNKRYAAVPMIIGDQEDEGTLFALFQPNITSTSRLVRYFKDIFFHGATEQQLTDLVNTYSPWPMAGSPFRTGIFNEIYPGYKRLAAMLGDLTFTLTRRAFLAVAAQVNPDVPSWSYLSSYDYGTPILGTLHGSDILQVFYGILPNYASRTIQGYYINFLYNLDPNVGTSFMQWPKWKEGQQLMNFFANKGALINDDFRQDSYEYIANNVAAFHI
ncbi:uncharacterized protein E0L32_007593 [Thyridium curvatum]|uniref:Carboxylic ester hydrolase n=1 Tax=Thyridium curvatum TaxID=1093900 RepID=A0A507AYT8_9PEZI|nr:uncharacterized protein E0L32_007593 [Thyridium curvatum]TPX11614.1 hypothetical protein E0L32_007593 [Thyridium curvatum]